MKNFFLLIITIFAINSIFSQENYVGYWQREDNSIYEVKNNQAILVKVGRVLKRGNFKIGDLKIKNIVVENGIIRGYRRVNTYDGNLLGWQKIRIVKRNNVANIIDDVTGKVLTSLRRINKKEALQIQNIVPKKLLGEWKRVNDGSIYSFEGDVAVIKRIGFQLERGKFHNNQIKIRNINQIGNESYSAQDRLNNKEGDLLLWNNVVINVENENLIIHSKRSNRVQKFHRVIAEDNKLLVAKENNVIRTDNEASVAVVADVDVNIPINNSVKSNTFALIVGNEDYSSFQIDLDNEVNVDFAANDAKIFKEYVVKTLGVPQKNVILITNATYGQMMQGISKLNKLSEISEGEAELIFYYAGHGLPDEITKEAYIMPVDISGSNVTSGIKIDDVYKKLLEFPNKKVTVFLDACFSGGARNQGLIAMRGVKIRPKENALFGNLVVFTSSSGNESSATLKEKQHGLFTYYLLKKLQETKGNISYKELADFLNHKIKLESVLINNKEQTPQTNVSPDVKDVWENWKFN